jgi:hypothetical protein
MAFQLSLLGMAATLILLQGAFAASAQRAHPVFEYEKRSLSKKTLRELIDKTNVADDAYLFFFEDRNDAKPSLLEKGACRAFPGDPEWPRERTWGAFNKLLDGALIETVPVAAPCYWNLGTYNAEKCAVVRDSYTDPYFQ